MKIFLTILLFATLETAAASTLSHGDEPVSYQMRAELGIMVEMRDGVSLSTDLYFPAGAMDKLPVILWRTVYGKKNAYENDPLFAALVKRGYVVATQDMRGRGSSEGDFKPTIGDRNDSYDTASWLTSQPWSNQKLGTSGCSAHGEIQLALAATRHPHHVTAIPQSSAAGYNIRGRPWAGFDGGAFELAQTAGWFSGDGSRLDFTTLPIVDMLKEIGVTSTEYENFASSNPVGDYYQSLEWLVPDDRLDIPVLLFDSWYDYGPAESLELFNVLQRESLSARARENQFVIVAPNTHCGYLDTDQNNIVGERDLGDARLDVLDLQLRWFDFWMKGIDNGITDMPKIQYYLMGANEWKSADAWPIPGTRYEKLYLAGNGQANSSEGDGLLSFELQANTKPGRFVYNPATPVPSLGGHSCCTGTDTESGSYDQSQIEMRADVLVYTSAVLEQGLEVTGPLKVVLSVSSSAKDTDFTAKLVDVYPDGRAFNIEEAALRMRYREGFEKDLRMEPDEIYQVHLDLHVTSNYFGPGHRFRLEVSSSNFPRWDRNLNTGGSNFDESEFVAATNTVHHSEEHPSYIVLPIVAQ
jgi:predicted acyl esterase